MVAGNRTVFGLVWMVVLAGAATMMARGDESPRLVAHAKAPSYTDLIKGPAQYRPVQGKTFWFSLGGGETEPAHVATLKARAIADLGPISCGVAEWGYSFHYLKNGQEDGAGYKHYGGYPTPPKTRQEAMEVVHRYYQRLAADARAKATPEQLSLFSTINGHYCYQHYGCEWGCDIVGSETGENINSTQAHIAFTRGAARQYGKPWLIDFSSWYGPSMYDDDPAKHWGKFSGPDRGHSISLHVRTYYIAYMAGAEVVVAEGGWLNCFKSQTPGPDGMLPLSGLGKQAAEFYRFTRRHPERGVPYAPVGVLLDYYHGIYPGFDKKLAWNVFPYTAGDQEILDTWETFFPDSVDVQKKRNEKGYLVASPFGDIVDVLLTNAPSAALAEYPVLLLAGDVTYSAELADRLRNYVRLGGTLLVGESNARNSAFAHALEFHDMGLPASGFVRLKRGRGALVVYSTSTHDVLPGLLGKARAELIPVSVTGRFETLYSRTAHGWLVTLVNNEGITKSYNEAHKIEANAVQTAHLTWNGSGRVASASVWGVESDQVLDVKNLSVSVPPGEVRVVELRVKPGLFHGNP